MKPKPNLKWSGDSLIEDILPSEAKLSLPHTANCADALEQLRMSRLSNALVKNMAGGYLGVVAATTLHQLAEQGQTQPIEQFLEKVTHVCTPKCNAEDVANRLFNSGAPYVLVVDASGRLLNFLEPFDFEERDSQATTDA